MEWFGPGDERTRRAECLAEGPDKDVRANSGCRAFAATVGTEDAEGVGLVDVEMEFFAGGDLPEVGQRRDVPVHAEETFGDDPTAAERPGFGDGCFERLGIAVRVDDDASATQPTRVDKAGVIERVAEDDVFGS